MLYLESMKTSELKEKLHFYIDTAKTEKLKAIYTMLEDDIEQRMVKEEEAYYDELDRRVADMESGKTRTYTWEEVKANTAKHLKKVKVKK